LTSRDYNGESLEKLGIYTISEGAILLRVQVVEEQLEDQRKVMRLVLSLRTDQSCLVLGKEKGKRKAKLKP
jgi:hypothetical protein